MKKMFSLVLVLSMAFAVFGGISTASAAARTLSWVVSITYQNVGTSATTVEVDFYEEESGTLITTFEPLGTGNTLAAGAGASFYIGAVSAVSEGFRGNAVMKSQQPLVATVVQFTQETKSDGSKYPVRMMSNAFQSADGSKQYLIATTLKEKFNRTSIFSIQNTGGAAVDATVRFYDAENNGSLKSTKVFTIPGNSSKYIEMDSVDDTGISDSVFNGSAIVSVPDGSTVVAAASELSTNTDIGANFEGLPLSKAGNKIYMATALCAKFGMDTFYAVENASVTPGENATISVTYKNLNGTTKAVDGPYTIGPGQKKSIITCTPSDGTNMSDFTGAATISTGTGDAPIVVIGKGQCSSSACTSDKEFVYTAFLGEKEGASSLAMPYVRWSENCAYNGPIPGCDPTTPINDGGKQRAYIAIQNLESTSSKIVVEYWDKDGTVVGSETLTIEPGSKQNSTAESAGALGKSGMNPGEFGYYVLGQFGGSVLAYAHSDNPTAKFIAIVRSQVPVYAEDYNAVPVP